MMNSIPIVIYEKINLKYFSNFLEKCFGFSLEKATHARIWYLQLLKPANFTYKSRALCDHGHTAEEVLALMNG